MDTKEIIENIKACEDFESADQFFVKLDRQELNNQMVSTIGRKLNKFSNHNYYYNHVYQNPIPKPNNNNYLYHDDIKQIKKNKYNIDRFINQNNNKNLNNYPQFNAQYYKNKYSKNYNIINGRHLPPIL